VVSRRGIETAVLVPIEEWRRGQARSRPSSVSLGEIQAGIEITREQDAAKASAWAQLMHRRSDTLEDAMIAAVALVHGLTVVTRNVKDFDGFDGFGVALFNPFQYKGALRAANRR